MEATTVTRTTQFVIRYRANGVESALSGLGDFADLQQGLNAVAALNAVNFGSTPVHFWLADLPTLHKVGQTVCIHGDAEWTGQVVGWTDEDAAIVRHRSGALFEYAIDEITPVR